jgi:acid stress-induced BolA-like protein IbaG/YrbA
MDPLIQQVQDLLKTAFPRSEPRFDPVAGNGRIFGVLVWDPFEGTEQIDRQREVWKVLRERLAPEDQRRVAAVLTVTSHEISDD